MRSPLLHTLRHRACSQPAAFYLGLQPALVTQEPWYSSVALVDPPHVQGTVAGGAWASQCRAAFFPGVFCRGWLSLQGTRAHS